MTRRRAALMGLAALAALEVPGCGVQGLAFRQDTSLRITSPADRSTVILPVTVTWEAPAETQRYGVFVDQNPQPPGQTLRWFARDDAACRVRDGCPDEAYLANLGVFTTTAAMFTIAAVPPEPPSSRAVDLHDITVVVLDDATRRMGERAATVEVVVDRARQGP